jgi:hypothetical protein
MTDWQRHYTNQAHPIMKYRLWCFFAYPCTKPHDKLAATKCLWMRATGEDSTRSYPCLVASLTVCTVSIISPKQQCWISWWRSVSRHKGKRIWLSIVRSLTHADRKRWSSRVTSRRRRERFHLRTYARRVYRSDEADVGKPLCRWSLHLHVHGLTGCRTGDECLRKKSGEMRAFSVWSRRGRLVSCEAVMIV